MKKMKIHQIIELLLSTSFRTIEYLLSFMSNTKKTSKLDVIYRDLKTVPLSTPCLPAVLFSVSSVKVNIPGEERVNYQGGRLNKRGQEQQKGNELVITVSMVAHSHVWLHVSSFV